MYPSELSIGDLATTLIDQPFNSSKKHLASTLLLLARRGKQEQPAGLLPKVSQETLASSLTRKFLHEQISQARLHRGTGKSE